MLLNYHYTWTDAWTDNANPRVALQLKNEFLTLGRKVFFRFKLFINYDFINDIDIVVDVIAVVPDIVPDCVIFLSGS